MMRFVFMLMLLVAARPCLAQESGASQFRVALTGKYPPFSMYDNEGRLVGFDVDVSREIAKRLGRKLDLVATEWDGILPGLLANKYDAIIGSMAITVERQKKVDFSQPYYESGAQLFVHQKNRGMIKGIQDCSGKRIGVVLGETYENYLVQKHQELTTVTYKSTVDVFRDVENGRIFGFVSDKLLGAYQIKEGGKPFVPVGELLYREKMGIPMQKSRPALLAAINTALEEMRADGVREELFNKWFGLASNTSALSRSVGMSAGAVTRMLINGFGITLLIAFASIVLGFLLAVPEGLILNQAGVPNTGVGLGFIVVIVRNFNDFIRGTPVLIQLLFVYYGPAAWASANLGIKDSAVATAIFTLSINASAYMAEVVRSGLMSVDSGQYDAARALGLTKRQTFFLVVWPQAFRIALPPLMNSVVALIKDTALVSVITVGEVIRQAQSIISVTFDPTKYYLIVAVMFFVVTFPLMKFAARLERQIREKGFVR